MIEHDLNNLLCHFPNLLNKILTDCSTCNDSYDLIATPPALLCDTSTSRWVNTLRFSARYQFSFLSCVQK